MVRTAGLLVFLTVFFGTLVALTIDLGLDLRGLTTISQECRESPAFATVVLGWLVTGFAGLLVHLFAPLDEEE